MGWRLQANLLGHELAFIKCDDGLRLRLGARLVDGQSSFPARPAPAPTYPSLALQRQRPIAIVALAAAQGSTARIILRVEPGVLAELARAVDIKLHVLGRLTPPRDAGIYV